MNYEHPTIKIECPVPGHYCISGHRPQAVFVPEVGHLVPPGQIHVPPELPDEVLLAVLEDRRARREASASEAPAEGEPKAGPKRRNSRPEVDKVLAGPARRGRAAKAQAEVQAMEVTV